MTSERTLSRSKKVGAFSILKNVRDHGIRSATDEDEVNGIRRACAVVLEGFDAIPELPLVSPENLVEGEWYVVGDVPTWYYCGRFHTFFKDGTSRIGFWPEEGIHGPLRFRIGGAE